MRISFILCLVLTLGCTKVDDELSPEPNTGLGTDTDSDGSDADDGPPNPDSPTESDTASHDTAAKDTASIDDEHVDSGSADTASGDTASEDTSTPEPTPTADLDGDGFSEADGDCDDLDSSIHPDRDEVCDGIDNNCNEAIDEDVIPTWYLDFDGDGYGTDAFTYDACTPLSGYVDNADDCDDTTELASPDGVEVCDERDNDCNGMVDEDVTTTYFLDDDGDGFGDAGFTIEACMVPSGYSDNALDCWDDRSDVSPTAEEQCDGIDNDCDDEVDEGDATDAILFFEDADEDDFGDPLSTVRACAAPSGYIIDASDCDDTDDDVFPGALERCDGEDNDCDGDTDETGSLGETIGYADVDEDGYGDPVAPLSACTLPATHVTNALDCDDTRTDTNPEATESCDGRDNDCDGTTDEAGSIGEVRWYADADADEHGSLTVFVEACSAPIGHIADSSDCDDRDNDTYPGALEQCDGEDNDCDGDVDEDAEGGVIWYLDADDDGYGSLTDTVVACTAPEGAIATTGDCDDTEPEVSPEQTESCNGIDDDCDGLTDEAGAIGATPWFEDGDADGFGDPDSRIVSCEAPDGFVADNTDCNPTRGDTFPGAVEVAGDEIDQDCDGVDLEDDGPTGSETGWYQANYDGVFSDFDPSMGYDGSISCGATCAHYGKTAVGARFVCNVSHLFSGSTEGCGPHNEGLYGESNCGWMVRDMVELTENGNTEDCTRSSVMECVTGSCEETVTYHSVECQCE